MYAIARTLRRVTAGASGRGGWRSPLTLTARAAAVSAAHMHTAVTAARRTAVATRALAVTAQSQRRWLSTDGGDKPMTAAERKAAFLAAQKSAAGGQQWGAFSGSKNESTLSAAERAATEIKADDKSKPAAAAAGAGGGAAGADGAADGAEAVDPAAAAAAAEEAAKAAAAAKKKAQRLGLKNPIAELKHLRDFFNRNNVQATTTGLQKRRLAKGESPADVLKNQPVSNIVANTDEKALVFVETQRTVWEERIDSIRDWVSASAPMRGSRQLKHTLQTSDNALIERSRAAHQALRDRIEDWRNVYDESQHPLIWKVRDVQDRVMGETDIAFAVGQLRKQDPAFDQEAFVKYMEEYMIPRVIDAYLKPDAPTLRLVTEGNAARFMAATLKEREVQGHYWDTRTLDLHSVEMKEATVIEDVPLVVMTFMCQHVECVRDRTGKIVQGHESNLKMAYWSWVVRRDFENPFFDWKIVELQTQRVHSLV